MCVDQPRKQGRVTEVDHNDVLGQFGVACLDPDHRAILDENRAATGDESLPVKHPRRTKCLHDP
jgi:hypothetical protein